MIVRELITKLGFEVDNRKLDQFEKSIDNTKAKLESFRNNFLAILKTLNACTAL